MFCRTRKSNLSLERAIYKPAEKDADGKIVVHPVRTTEYVGSISKHIRFANVPADLLAKLDDDEKTVLRLALEDNEPKPDYWLANLPRYVERSAEELSACAGRISCAEERKDLEIRVKAVEAAWRRFFKTAQELGLKRKVNRPKKAAASDTMTQQTQQTQDPT